MSGASGNLIIRCPRCEYEFPLTESLAAPLVDELKAKHSEDLRAAQEAHSHRLEIEKDKLIKEIEERARKKVASEIEDMSTEAESLREEIEKRGAKLAEAQKTQADFLKKQRELEEKERELDLAVEGKVRDEVSAVREKARQEAEQSIGLKVTEKEEVISSMRVQIETLQRKIEQGSQQLQGEAQEIELENLFRSRFPDDEISPVGKGERGGDIVQKVVGPTGKACGTIVWESKRTKAWVDGWLPKLREDQRTAKAEIAAIVSQSLPKGVETFDLIDGVWVSSVRAALPVAIALRQVLIEASRVRQASEGMKDKAEVVYEYIAGSRFKQRIQAIVEAFSIMKEDLDKERKVTVKQWAKREEQLKCAVESTAGMFGDLQGIAGRVLSEIEGLEIP